MFKLDLEKAEEPDQIANICWIIGKARRVPEKQLLLLYWLCQSIWLCGSQQTVDNSERDGNTRPPSLSPEKPVCSQEATVKILHGTTDWFKIGKGVQQHYILSPYSFNLCAECVFACLVTSVVSDSNCCFLTGIQVSQEAGKVVWYCCLLKHFPQLVLMHTVKCFGIVNKAKVDVFLELSWFF